MKAIAKGGPAETERKLAQMRVLEREGTDVFHTLRGKTFDKLEDLADGLTDFEQRKVFSTALKEMDDITLGKLNKDLENEAFRNYLVGNVESVEAWEVVKLRKAQIRIDIPSLEALHKLLTNPNRKVLGLTEEIIGTIKGSQKLAYKDVLKTLDDFGLNIQSKDINLLDFSKVLGDLVKGDGWTEGTEWALKYISNNVTDFSRRSIRFEVYTKWDDLSGTYIRITDVIDETNPAFKVLYEFKSVKHVPPGKFNEQFIKDLSNPDVTDLDQIRWIFDGRKSPDDFIPNITTAINNLQLTKELAEKILQNPQATISDLRIEILINIKNIFKLAN